MPSWDELGASTRGPGLPVGVSPLRQPARCRGPDPGNLYPGFPVGAELPAGDLRGLLHRITTNLFLDMVRRRGRVRMEALPEGLRPVVPADEPNPEEIYHDAHLGPDLQAALDSLPPRVRAAVVLCDIEGLSYEEIGATLA